LKSVVKLKSQSRKLRRIHRYHAEIMRNRSSEIVKKMRQPGPMEKDPDYLPPGPRSEARETAVLDQWASELSDDVEDKSIVGNLSDQPAQIRCMKPPVGARCGPDLVMKLLLLWVNRAQRYRPGCGRWRPRMA
jgi:hypothetical protein